MARREKKQKQESDLKNKKSFLFLSAAFVKGLTRQLLKAYEGKTGGLAGEGAVHQV